MANELWGRSVPCSNVGGLEYGKPYCKLGLPCGTECIKCDKYTPDPKYTDQEMVKAAIFILEEVYGNGRPNLHQQN